MSAPRAIALCFSFKGALDFQTGRWGKAEKGLRDAVELYQQVGSASGEALSQQRLGVLLTAKGKLDEGWSVMQDGLLTAERAAMRSHCLTRLHASMIRNRLAADDTDGVKLGLLEGLEAARRHGHCVTCNALLLPELVRAEISAGNVADAATYASDLEKAAAGFDSRAWSAMAAHAQARVRLAKKESKKACELFDVAAQAFREAEQPYEVARCLMGHANALDLSRAKKSKAQAELFRQQAQEIFTGLNAPGIEV